MRAASVDRTSPWTEPAAVEAGPVEVVEAIGAAGDAPLGLLLRTFWYGLVHLATTW
jgi:hypothetical protein